jgi:hypothetical protein
MKSLLDGATKWKYNPAWSLSNEDNAVWDDPSLSFRAKGVWGYMRSKKGAWDFSSQRMAKDALDGRRVVLNAINELVGAGYVSKTKLGSGRMFYEISGEPYVGVEPTIEKSPFQKLKMDMGSGGMYDGLKDYRANGVVQTIGEPKPHVEYIGVTNAPDAVLELEREGWVSCDATKTVNAWTQACLEASLPLCETTWSSWKQHARRGVAL